jgi:hypothetical protein
MKGYCPKCREYRSDEGENAFGIRHRKYGAVCRKCGSIIDMFE